MLRPPQTGRQPLSSSSGERKRLLAEPHIGDTTDLFATDINPEVRELGLLALRREDVNDLFALGDLCANLSITENNRLSMFYVGKVITAYERAGTQANNDIDRKMARRALDNYLAWVVQVSQTATTRRNIAVALWALAEHEESILPHIGIDENVLGELIDQYMQKSMGTRMGVEPVPMDEEMPDPLEDTSEDTAPIDDPKTVMDGGNIPLELEHEEDLDVSDANPSSVDDEEQPGSKDTYVSPDVIHTEGDDDELQLSDYAEPSATIVGTDDDMALSIASGDYDSERDTIIAEQQTSESSMGILGIRRRRTTRKKKRRRKNEPSENEFEVGDKIEDRYDVVDVKRGGMGIVYLCYDHQERTPVAIKSFQSRFLKNERAVARFTQEALTWIRLEKHRYIVQARLVQTISGRPHIILEHISGPEGLGADLRSWIDHNRIDNV
ncbi:MAG: hypothetical protein AAF125_07060, partial [Chloroflexota bacterium]